jgi:hypothetical protein
MLPLIALLLAVAAVAGRFTSVTFASVPHIQYRLVTGLIGSLAIASGWAFLVSRDSPKFWPARGWKRFCLLLVAAGCLAGTVAPPVLYARLVSHTFDRLRNSPEAKEALDSLVRLEHESAAVLKIPRSDPTRETRMATLNASVDDLADRMQTPRCKSHGVPCLQLKWLLLERDRDLAPPTAAAFASALLALAVIVAVQETSLALVLTVASCFGGYSVFVLVLLSFFGKDGKLIGILVVLHGVALAIASCAQWLYRTSGWFSRVTAVTLSLVTPFVTLGWMLARGAEFHDDDLPRLALMSFVVYIGFSPFIQGNLVRLRYLPQP